MLLHYFVLRSLAKNKMVESPGLVVTGVDSFSKGHGFKSRHRILDGHFFTYICCKNCNDVCLKRPKINDKRGRVWPNFFKKKELKDLSKHSLNLSSQEEEQ